MRNFIKVTVIHIVLRSSCIIIIPKYVFQTESPPFKAVLLNLITKEIAFKQSSHPDVYAVIMVAHRGNISGAQYLNHCDKLSDVARGNTISELIRMYPDSK